MASKKQAIEKFNEGKIRSALNIAKNFKLGVTDEEREIMALGYECEVHPEFYSQIGKDIEEAKAAALVVLKKVLGIVDPEPEEAEIEEKEFEKNTWLLLMKTKRGIGMFMFILYTEDIQKEIKALRNEGYAFVLCLNLHKAKKYLDGNEYGMRGVIQNYEVAGFSANPKDFFKEFVDLAGTGNLEMKVGVDYEGKTFAA